MYQNSTQCHVMWKTYINDVGLNSEKNKQLEQWKSKTKQENSTAELLWTALHGRCEGSEAIECPGPQRHCMHLLWVMRREWANTSDLLVPAVSVPENPEGKDCQHSHPVWRGECPAETKWNTNPHSHNRRHLCLSHCRAPASPGLHPKSYFPFWASCSVCFWEPRGWLSL